MYPEYSSTLQFLVPQVQDAAAGVHLYSVSPIFPWDNGAAAQLDFSATDQYLDNVLAVDPQGIFLLQIGVWPGPGWEPPVAPTSADQIVYLSGPTTDVYHISMASDIYFNGLVTIVFIGGWHSGASVSRNRLVPSSQNRMVKR